MASHPQGMDVVGVDNGSHGRSCTQHAVCGHFVSKEDILYCNWAVQKFDSDIPESCVQVFKLAMDGHVAGCHVGYLPRRVIKSSRSADDRRKKDGGKSHDGTWLKVVSDLRLSDNSAERSRSHRNFGILYCHVLKDEYLLGKNPFEQCIVFPESEKNKGFQLPSPAPKQPVDDDEKTQTPDINEIRRLEDAFEETTDEDE
jgi:hypothetical protein